MNRKTAQRACLREVFEKAERPLSVHEVLTESSRKIPQIGIATIYRNIKRLCDQEWLVRVELPGDTPRFEVANGSNHHYFHCRKCRKVYGAKGETRPMEHLVPHGFHLENQEVVLYGVCSQCQ